MMKSLKSKKSIVLCLLLVGLAVFSWPGAAAAQEVNDLNVVDPNLQEPQIPGRIEGTGTYFEVNDSNYLNITFQSSEPVHLTLESVPEMIVMDINTAAGAASTQITLTGFESSTTYYKYEDDYHNEVAFTTDGNGSYTFAQDLTQPHLVFIQTQPGTKFIRDDATGGDASSIGTWDWATKTCTLGMDLNETIQIDSDGITLDGAGHTVTGSGSGSGVYLYGRTAVTIKNINVQGFSYGIYLYSSSGNTLTGNTASNNYHYGIHVYRSSNNTLTANTTNSNSWCGIFLHRSSSNTLTGNTASNNYYGIVLFNSSNNTLTGNTANSNNNYGIFLNACSNSRIYNNNFIDNATQASVYYSSGNVFNLDKPIGGNYWSNWTTPDADVDGFVDNPYVFYGGVDNLPLATPYVSNQPPVADAGGPYVEQATSWDDAYVDLDGTGSSDPDGDALTYEWDMDLSWDSDGDGDPNNDVDETKPTSTWIFPIGQTEISLVVMDEYGFESEPDVTTVTITMFDVAIDIKPGSYPNSINMCSRGVIPVAFLTDPEFDASTIDPATVTLRGADFDDGLVKLRGKKDAPVPMANMEDVDGDGDLDLVVHLETEKLAEYELDAICEIGALTYDGYVVSGSDTIRVVPE